MGIPTAPIVTIAFKDLAYSNAAQRGMPHERICFTPHPVWGKSDAQMYAYLEGDDPVTHKPLMPEIISALTKPLSPDEEKTGTVTPPVGPESFSGTQDELQDYYMNNGMTDFMAIILPTREKVDAMLKATSHSPGEGFVSGVVLYGSQRRRERRDGRMRPKLLPDRAGHRR